MSYANNDSEKSHAKKEILPPFSRQNDKTLVLLSANSLAVGRTQHSHPSASKLAPPLRQRRNLNHAVRAAKG